MAGTERHPYRLALVMLDFGHLGTHMLQHIVLMNLAAPSLALVLAGWVPTVPARLMWAATLLQMALLWAAHAPPLLVASMLTTWLHLAMQAILFLSALMYWLAIIGTPPRDRWNAILSLLLTAKLFCLLGVLFVFAPRELFPVTGHSPAGALPSAAIEDQQLAGLLMLAACPAAYLLAGVIVAAKWIGILASDPKPEPAISHDAAR